MSKRIALLEYTFLFTPETAWHSGTEFEKDLGDFFGAHGYDAEVIETVGNSNRRILYLRKVEIAPAPIPPVAKPVQSEKTPSQILNQMGSTKGFDGKFKRRNK